LVLAMLLAFVLPVALAQDDGEGLPEEIVFAAGGIAPEGIEYYEEDGVFLVGSLTQGTIFAVFDDGSVEPFIEDEDLASTVGIHIDAANNRLLVTNADASVFQNQDATGMAQLAAYDLATGERIYLVNLGELVEDGRHFANDVTSAPDGTAYVTDSFSPVIYEVTPDGAATILLEDEALGDDQIGLNGIDYHADGYLVVALTGQARLFKVPVESPAEFSAVELENPVAGDGLVFHPNGNLVIVGGNAQLVVLSSDDEWASASEVEVVELQPADESPTTAVIRDNHVYVTFAQLNNFQAEQYRIQQAGLAEDTIAVDEEMMDGEDMDEDEMDDDDMEDGDMEDGPAATEEPSG
jgi:sugar lactone lactonase YvrE